MFVGGVVTLDRLQNGAEFATCRAQAEDRTQRCTLACAALQCLHLVRSKPQGQLDPSTLIAKGVIDLVVCLPLAATMGIGVPFCGVSLVVYEGILSVLASLMGPLLSDAVILQMGVTGSVLLLAVGTNLMGVTDLKVANILPAAFLPIVLVPLAGVVPSIL